MTKKFSIEELEGYRVFAAYMVLEFGGEYGFVLERVERMLDRARREDPVAKALRIMEEMKMVREQGAGTRGGKMIGRR